MSVSTRVGNTSARLRYPRLAPSFLAWSHLTALERVDGDHSYDGVLADWCVFGSAMAPGGVVAFHDVGWAAGVQRIVAEHVRPNVVAEGGLPDLWWGRLRR